MQVNTAVKSGLKYIEQNLKSVITAEELSRLAGYSVWHYCRLFSEATGLPVAGYICKRRLDKALAEMSKGRKAVDAAMDYGFKTYAGFYKAFVRMYGCAPKKYLSLYGKYQPIRFGGILIITESELRGVIANWNVPQDLPIGDIFVKESVEISTNIWTLGDDYILKTGERSRMLKDLRLRKALAKQGFTAAVTISTKSGEDYLDGERIYTLTQKIPGEPLSKRDRFGENRREFGEKYGRSIAKLHRALAAVEDDIAPDETDIYERVKQFGIPNVFGNLPKQLIHRDPSPSNILFENGEIRGFIDFDLGERNIRLWDPCYCATGILFECWSDGVREIWFDVLEGILHGYNSVNPLTIEEKQALFYVICSIQNICISYFESVDEYKDLAGINREMLRFIEENRERICEI